MKRVLLISYYFPPEGGAGTQRCAKFAKYLPQFGWQPVVLTRAPEKKSDYVAEDRSLLGDIGAEVEVIRVTAGGEPTSWARRVPQIDVGRTWLEPAFDAISRRFEEGERVDAVVVSMSPFDLSDLGLRIGERFDIPVIFDLRDPWALDGWRLRGDYLRWRRDFKAMKRTLPLADGVVANTSEARRQFLNHIPSLNAERVITIPNGFDHEDFNIRPVQRSGGKMTICHVGTFLCDELYRYEGLAGRLKKLKHYRPEPIDPSGRTPLYLLRALRMLRDRGESVAKNVRVLLIGSHDSDTIRCVKESGVSDLVELTGYMAHDQAVEQLMSADVLFAALHGLPVDRRSRIVPGKVYEYLGTGRPMLGCLPQGDARDLVTKAGWPCADPCDAQQIAEAIVGLHRRWSQGEFRELRRPGWLEEYERRNLTLKLASFIDGIAGLTRAEDRSRALPEMSVAHG